MPNDNTSPDTTFKLRSAEEWSSEVAYIQGVNMANRQYTMSSSVTKAWIEEIQLNAYKAGMLAAANIIRRELESHGCINACDACDAKRNCMIDIETAARSLKELSKIS